jgi:hypothetical protein
LIRFEREANILRGEFSCSPELSEKNPEAFHLILQLTQPSPLQRLTASQALSHPFFWDLQTRLNFLKDASDRIEIEREKKLNHPMIEEMERGGIEGIRRGYFSHCFVVYHRNMNNNGSREESSQKFQFKKNNAGMRKI